MTEEPGKSDELVRAELIERQPCPRCEVPAGSPCRTHTGLVASVYHTGRYAGLPKLRSGPAVRMLAARRPGQLWQPGPAPQITEAVAERPGDRIGYARASRRGQDLTAQMAALGAAGCVRIFDEVISTRQPTRPKYVQARDSLRTNDILTVQRLDRLGRNMVELIVSAQDIQHLGNRLEILSGPLAGVYDPQGPGKILFVVVAVFAEIEREFIHERTMDGLATAHAKGRRGGRPRAVSADQLAAALARRDREEPVPAIAAALGVKRSTLYRALDEHDQAAAMAALAGAADED
ncbi:recombinase family protein (plasmid) [Streptomyces sp. NBC_00377]|uniref:recombinase family protein n=1 Tax=unclassified Streptomyces TaxID=2593676 RepID=UPI002E22AE0A|nr:MULTISPECIES: recombinase family protein [unclassified Streptomyces]